MVSALDYPAIEGRPVTQGHADLCKAHGHASHVVDGIATPHCPRCGERRHTERPVPRPLRTDGTMVTCSCGESFALDSQAELDHYVWAVRSNGETSNLGHCPVTHGGMTAVASARWSLGFNRVAYRGEYV